MPAASGCQPAISTSPTNATWRVRLRPTRPGRVDPVNAINVLIPIDRSPAVELGNGAHQ